MEWCRPCNWIRPAWILVFVLATPLPSSSRVVLSELMYDPEGTDHHDEFVELVNIGDDVENLDGWSVGDEFDLDRLVGDDLWLRAGQYALVLDGSYEGGETKRYDDVPDEVLVLTIEDKAFGARGWPNGKAGKVLLRDVAGDTVETFTYQPLDQPGRTYEKRTLAGGSTPDNWEPARCLGGTPGRLNSADPDAGVSKRLWLSARPNPFSESLTVEYRVSATPAIVNVWVYDVVGNLQRKLIDHAQARSADAVVWDGCDRHGTAVPLGAYVLYASANVQGRLAQVKTAVVRSAAPE